MTDEEKTYSYEEVAKHDLLRDLWLVVNNSVYNMTSWVESHTGNPESIIKRAGKDATLAFYDFCDPQDASDKLKEFKVGELVEEERSSIAQLRRKEHGLEYNII